ncbi:MAG: 5'/3'-nucleotidase SurE [Anaerolineales bacterium]|nr:5'/3'-nucleotidase SurE [Anaerolineales bacterium]
MHLLLTNDDGVDAPGLLALAQAMRALGQVSVLAPNRNWSASGHVKTLHRPLRVWPTVLADGSAAFTTDGAPSDCVALAVLGLIETPIDLVVSGINPHANVGHDVTYSGTVTAAMEAMIAGLPALAVSLDSEHEPSSVDDYRCAANVARTLAERVRDLGLPSGVLLNVNVPARPQQELRGMTLTRQGLRVYRDALVRREDPRGRPYYWIGGEAPTGILEQGTDLWALSEGWVSITPLHLDLTAYPALSSLAPLLEPL